MLNTSLVHLKKEYYATTIARIIEEPDVKKPITDGVTATWLKTRQRLP